MCHSGWEIVAANSCGWWTKVYAPIISRDPDIVRVMSTKMSEDIIGMLEEVALPDNAASKLHCTEESLAYHCGTDFDYTVTE